MPPPAAPPEVILVVTVQIERAEGGRTLNETAFAESLATLLPGAAIGIFAGYLLAARRRCAARARSAAADVRDVPR